MQSQQNIENVFRNIYGEVFGQELSFEDFNQTLADKGVDSLDVMDFVYNIEEKFNIRIDMNMKNYGSTTISDLINIVKAKIL